MIRFACRATAPLRHCVLILLLAAALALQLGARQRASVSATIDRPNLHPGESALLNVTIVIPPGLHAQSHTPLDANLIPLEVTLNDNPAIAAQPPTYPPAQILTFAALGKVSAYPGSITVQIPFAIRAGAAPATVKLDGHVHLQACNETACFPPETATFEANVQIVPGAAAPTATAPAAQPPATAPPAPSTPPPAPSAAPAALASPPPLRIFGHDLTADAYLLAFAAAFVVGIIFNAMPCVLPVVPLKIMGFYEVSQHDRRKSIGLGAVFSAGVIFSFAVLALLIVVLHVIDWGGLFRQSWFTVGIVAVLIAMAAQTFGVFEIALPVGIYSWTPRHDTVSGNFLFGILTAALSTPCTFGLFAGLLVWALAQPAWIGSSLLITVGVGMAFPYFVLSGFPQLARNFPRAGPWSAIVKQMMGFLLLGTAVYFAQPLIQRFVSPDAFWWMLFGIVAAGALFLIARAAMVSYPRWPVFVAGAVALGTVVPAFITVKKITWHPYQWQAYSPAALATAQAQGRPVLIDFTATWCGNCHYIEAFVLHDQKVVRAVHDADVLMLQADVTDTSAIGQPLLDQLDASHAIPLTAVYVPHEQGPILLTGIYSASDLVQTLQRAK